MILKEEHQVSPNIWSEDGFVQVAVVSVDKILMDNMLLALYIL